LGYLARRSANRATCHVGRNARQRGKESVASAPAADALAGENGSSSVEGVGAQLLAERV
jgi:hypothetical protein